MFLRNAAMIALSAVTLFSTACQDPAAMEDEAALADEAAVDQLETEAEATELPELELYSVDTIFLAPGNSAQVHSAGFGDTTIKAKVVGGGTGEFCVQAGFGGEDCTGEFTNKKTIKRGFWGFDVTITNIGDTTLKLTILA